MSTTERDHAREQTHDTHAAADHDVAPGRAARSAHLQAPRRPVASGILMRKASGTTGQGSEKAVAAASASSGQALPEELRSKFESSLGTDLSSVRVHTGSESHAATRAVGAHAYALGNDIHFAAGQYDPDSEKGQHLIAHEIAHTVQQRGSSQVRQNKLAISTPGDSFEVEADRAAAAMVSGQQASVGSVGPTSVIQRAEDDNAHNPDSSNSYSNQEGLTWENGTALHEDEVTQWKDKQASTKAAVEKYVELTTGLKISLTESELIEKLEAQVDEEYKADIRTREGEIAWLENEIDALDDKAESGMLWWKKTDATAAKKAEEQKERLRLAEAGLENKLNERTAEVARVAKGAAGVIATLNKFVDHATVIGSGANAQVQALNPAVFADLADASSKVAMITSMVDMAATGCDMTALNNFQNEPSYESAKAWATQVGAVFQSAAGLASGLPGGWGEVISKMMSMPAVVPAEFAKVLEKRYAAIDKETKDGDGKGKVLDLGTSGS